MSTLLLVNTRIDDTSLGTGRKPAKGQGYENFSHNLRGLVTWENFSCFLSHMFIQSQPRVLARSPTELSAGL